MSDADYQSPAERELEKYLESLREDDLQPDPNLLPHIVRRARWQRAIRAPLRAVGSIVGALTDGVAVLLGSSRGQQP